MALGRSENLKVAIAVATVVLSTLLFRVLILPLLPPLQLVVSQLVVRMRDVLAFLAFTTVIAVGIFSSQQKDVQNHNARKKHFLEHHPLGSIFGETENAHEMAEEDVHALAPGSKQMQVNNSNDDPAAAMVNGSSLHRRSAWLDMETSRGRKFLASKEGIMEPKLMKTLHRKSSSLDDSVNYEPDFEVAAQVVSPDRMVVQSASAKGKPLKRVSFSHPSPPREEGLDESGKQTREEMPEKQNVASTLSPGDITMQADAFIAKFKEQMRMQRLESFYRRRGLDRK